MADGKGPRRWHTAYRLFLIPVVATLWVPFYDRADPAIAGIPFFYWYQLAWVPLAALIYYLIYRASKRAGED